MRVREHHTLCGALDTVDYRTLDAVVANRLERKTSWCTGSTLGYHYSRRHGVVDEPVNLARYSCAALRVSCAECQRHHSRCEGWIECVHDTQTHSLECHLCLMPSWLNAPHGVLAAGPSHPHPTFSSDISCRSVEGE